MRGATLNDFVAGFFLKARDKKDAFIDESLELGKVVVATVKDNDIAGFQGDAGSDG